MNSPTLKVGSASRYFDGRADADAVYAFAAATNDLNDRYVTGEAAPPLFTAGLIMPALWESQDVGGERAAVLGASASVHGEHDVFYRGALTAGMALRWRASTYGARQVRGGVQTTQRIVVSDAAGSALVEHLWTNFHIGGAIDADVGETPPDHTFPEDSRARPFATRTVPVERDQAFRYAGVSADRAPHALDDEAARSEGYPGKILQGMCTFSMCSAALVDLGADGEVSRLRRFAGRFSAPAFPCKDLIVETFDAGETSEGDRVLAFEARQDGVAVVRHGRAEFAPSRG